MQENRNILISIILSILVLFIWSVFYEQPKIEEYQKDQIVQNAKEAKFKKTKNNIKDQIFIDRDEAILDSNQQRINIKNDKLKGSISLKGARFDDLELLQYQETIDENSANVKLLSPLKTFNHYFIDHHSLDHIHHHMIPTSHQSYDLIMH